MPKIVVNAFLTLDGVMQAPGAPDEDTEGGFVHGGWQAPYAEDVGGRLVTEGFADVGVSRLSLRGEKPMETIVCCAFDASSAVTAANTRNRSSFDSSSELFFSLWNDVKMIVHFS